MSDGYFEFNPIFGEFLPVYQGVVEINVDDAGDFTVKYSNGTVQKLGCITMYEQAVAAGYQGTPEEWAQTIVQVAAGANVTVTYQTTNSGTSHPTGGTWTTNPDPQPGKYVWSKVDTTWTNGNVNTYYTVSYMGLNGSVESVNGTTGAVIIDGESLHISRTDNTTIKDYIDENASSVISVNNMTGAVVINGTNAAISDEDSTSIKSYIDSKQSDVRTVNGLVGDVVITSENTTVSASDSRTVKQYIDSKASDVVSVNGLTGAVVITAENAPVSASDSRNIKTYIDEKPSDVTSVNSQTGAVVINGANLNIDSETSTSIKTYIDNSQPVYATDEEIDALFE